MRGVKRLGLIAALAIVGLAPAAAAQAAAQPSDQDRQFLEAIHQVNLAEIATGEMAQQKGVNQEVKDLGGRFVTDHTQLDQTVQSSASSAVVTLPDAPNQEQKTVLDQLEGLSGDEFDQRWISAQLTLHQQAMQLAETEVAQGSDPAVKQVAQDALPVLKAHHDALLALARKLGVPVPGVTPGAPSPSAPTGTPSPSAPTGTPSPTAPTGTPGPTAPTGTPVPTAPVPSPTGS